MGTRTKSTYPPISLAKSTNKPSQLSSQVKKQGQDGSSIDLVGIRDLRMEQKQKPTQL